VGRHRTICPNGKREDKRGEREKGRDMINRRCLTEKKIRPGFLLRYNRGKLVGGYNEVRGKILSGKGFASVGK